MTSSLLHPCSSPPTSPGRRPGRSRGRSLVAGVSALLGGISGVVLAAAPAGAAASAATATTPTTAWQNGAFNLDPLGVVSRDDIVMDKANTNPNTSMPLGNGALGVAAWGANGFTAQLNRSDTMPSRKSPGQVNIPGAVRDDAGG